MALCSCCGETAKYTCPSCGVQSCSVGCVKMHKSNSSCTGELDPTRHLDRTELFSAASFNRDYNFLQQIGRKIQLENHTRHTKTMGGRGAVTKREFVRSGVRVRSMPKSMSRAQINKSHWNKQHRYFEWTVEFVVQLSGASSVIKQMPESILVRDIACEFGEAKKLYLKDANEQLQYLRPDLALSDALRGHLIVEFPTILVRDLSSDSQISGTDSDSSSDSSAGSGSDSGSDSDSGSYSDSDSASDSGSDSSSNSGSVPDSNPGSDSNPESGSNGDSGSAAKSCGNGDGDGRPANTDSNNLAVSTLEAQSNAGEAS